jgi:predicted RNase H-like HicB family nuclease
MKIRDAIQRLGKRMAGDCPERKTATGNTPLIQTWSSDRCRPPVIGHSARNVEQCLESGGIEMKYLVIYEKSSAGWGAYAPICLTSALPARRAATLNEAKELIREAMEFHLEGTRQHGKPIPALSATTEYISV